MPSALALTILASSLTTVADWAGWHYVWRHEKIEGKNTPRKHSPSSIFISYYLPFMPTLAIILGPSILGLYNHGFEKVATVVLYSALTIITAGVSASGFTVKRRHLEEKKSRELIDVEDSLPDFAIEHLNWTLSLLALSSIFWAYLLFT